MECGSQKQDLLTWQCDKSKMHPHVSLSQYSHHRLLISPRSSVLLTDADVARRLKHSHLSRRERDGNVKGRLRSQTHVVLLLEEQAEGLRSGNGGQPWERANQKHQGHATQFVCLSIRQETHRDVLRYNTVYLHNMDSNSAMWLLCVIYRFGL